MKMHFFGLYRQGLIEDATIENADVVIALLTIALINESYSLILELAKSEKVMPILVKSISKDVIQSVGLKNILFGNQNKPIASLRDRDSAWVDVVKEVRKFVVYWEQKTVLKQLNPGEK